ncbi:MAG: heme-binding protein [Gemmatimonadetes bacterium]|nr:heme-binding protein [Gemmatimonadota bacterium]
MKLACYTGTRLRIATVLMLSLPGTGRMAAQTPRPQPIPKSGPIPTAPALEKQMLSDLTLPAGFTATLFAGPPVAMYPACVGESPDGAVFVCVDPNLSLSQLKGVGRIMRLVDTDGDGHADRYTTFAEMDSPRGIASDGRTVFVMHPPLLTAYRDTNGDGIADESRDIVTGLGFDLNFRGADHTTNNIQLGPDGWLYVAVGDYGFMNATGSDGRTIRHRGGAVVRVRPDGSHLEIVADGTRNIYDVALDPYARIFARDNTNDGDGWDTRLHYMAPGANMGYPARYQNFGAEHFPSLADYGAGAGVGSVWIQDPAWPVGFNNTLYTGDWAIQKIFRHALTPKGAIFDITQEDFLGVLRPADVTLDGSSNMYVASLAGGQFTYIGDSVGYLVQIRPTGATLLHERPVSKATIVQLLSTLGSGNALRRLHAQQELLRRGTSAVVERSLRQAIADERKPSDARAAALFTLKQLAGARANDALIAAASSADARVRETALRALADAPQGVSTSIFAKALSDPDAQVKVQAMHGLASANARDAAALLVPFTDTSDQALSHLAVSALVSLQASEAALKGIDGTPAVRAGSLRALAMMHDAATVSALIDNAGRTTDADTRAAVLHALARLYNREAEWKGDWWTTRPAHLGPYFDPSPWEESPRIRMALVNALTTASGDAFTSLVTDLVRNQVLPRGAAPLLVSVTANRDPLRAQIIGAMVGKTRVDDEVIAMATPLDAQGFSMHNPVAQLLAGEGALIPAAIPLARSAILDMRIDLEVRAALLGAMGQLPGKEGLDAAARVFSWMNPAPSALTAGTTADPLDAAWRRFVGDRRRAGELDYFIDQATTGEASRRTLAFAVLVQNIRAPRTPLAVRDKVVPVIDAAWTDAASAVSLAQAIRIMRLESQYTEKLQACSVAGRC